MGKPVNLRSNNNRASQVPPQLVPTSEEVVRRYENLGGSITRFPVFGADPLSTNIQLQHDREQHFISMNWEQIYGKLVNNNDADFCAAITTYVNTTRYLSE